MEIYLFYSYSFNCVTLWILNTNDIWLRYLGISIDAEEVVNNLRKKRVRKARVAGLRIHITVLRDS